MEKLKVNEHTCHILRQGEGPWLYWMTQKSCEEELQLLDKYIRQMVEEPYNLVAMEAESWNGDYSPWPAAAVFGREDFSGGGEKTLDCLKELIGMLDDGAPRYVGGYSLAGLFSLWAMYNDAPFQGAASCSGSLWYPQWQDWRQKKVLPEGCSVYLSLGKKEERTRNPLMAQVGDVTRRQYEALCSDEHVMHTTLVWHEGGHFSEPTLRMAKGFAWLLTR